MLRVDPMVSTYDFTYNPPHRIMWGITNEVPSAASAGLVAQRLNRKGRAPHFVFNPLDGELVQIYPLTQHSAVFAPTISQAYAVHVAVVAENGVPWTSEAYYSPEKWEPLMEALKPVEAPPVWPLGPPTATPEYGRCDELGHYALHQVHKAFPVMTGIDIRRTYE